MQRYIMMVDNPAISDYDYDMMMNRLKSFGKTISGRRTRD